MPSMSSRRAFLKSAPLAAAVAASIPIAVGARTVPMTPAEQMSFHLEQFKKAAQQLDSTIKRWDHLDDFSAVQNLDSHCAILVVAFRDVP